MNKPYSTDGPQAEAKSPTFVRSSELAERLNVHPATVRRYGAIGIFPRIEIVPRSYLYDLDECLGIIEAKRKKQPLTAN